MKPKIRIVVADDHPIFRDGLCKLLAVEEDFEVVAQAQDGWQALDVLRLYEPDILLLDLKMHGLDGLATLQRLQTAKNKTRVIVLTASDDENEFVQAMKLGSSGIVLKQTATEELIKSIRKVHAGEIWLDSRTTAVVIRQFVANDEGRPPLQVAAPAPEREPSALSQREREIVALVAQGFKNKEMAEMMFVSERLLAAEAALRESEERLRFAQQVASIGTFDWHIQTGVNTWTPELEAMYGLPRGGFPGTQAAWEALVHPDDRARAVQRAKESFETEAPAEDEWRVIWPDGSVRWLAARWQVFKNAAGKPIRMMGINIDVTDRKRMEEALRTSEERFRLAIKATNDAIWDIDLKAGTVSWNDTYSVHYGRPETADSWQFWIDRIHPEDRARTVDDFQAALGGGASSWSCEYRFRRVDGEWAYIYDRAYIARDASGNAWRVIGAMQDLTEQKKAEAALRESEERFRRVFEEGPLGLALVGKDYRFLKVNSALCQLLGYDEAELVQLSFVDITHPDDVRADVALAEHLFKREVPFYRIQKRYLKKNREIIWINLTASIILGPDGKPLHGLAMIEDITQIKRTQEEALLRQKLESVGTLAGGIAHDFNNLLGAVQAQAEMALTELDADSPGQEELNAIREVALRGSEIVRQLMIYAGTESAVVGPVDLSKTVDEMLSLLKVSVTKHAVIRTNLAQDLPAICASAAQIRQIVMNLITNASDAIGDRDGVLQVSTRRVTPKRESAAISSRTLPDGEYVELEVSDTGRGMSPQTQAKVFDPFFTTKSAGRGLGLAVVQGIVRSLNGAIHLTSEPDKGTTFQVLLPCAETTAGASGHAISGDGDLAVTSQHGTVLVVEDEGSLREPVVKMLRKAGFEVYEAADGTSAIDLLRTDGGRIDVILLDMTLPGAPSRDVVAEAASVRPDIRIVGCGCALRYRGQYVQPSLGRFRYTIPSSCLSPVLF